MSRKRNRKGKPVKLDEQLRMIQPHASGIDVGATSHFVAVPPGSDPEGQDVREFEAFTCGLHKLVQWLKVCKVESVAMESTGVYWIPLFELLEREGFEVKLVDARSSMNVSGRKSDISDCQWLQQLQSYGLLAAAFRPEDQVCVLRSYMRQRAMLVEHASQHIQHMQKALTQMNLKLQHVVSDVSGVTGLKIIRAILGGERHPATLAKFRDPHCKNPEEVIAKSLEGNYRTEHLFALQQAVDLYDFLQRKIAECDVQLEAHLKTFEDHSAGRDVPKTHKVRRSGVHDNAPSFDLRTALFRMAGVDLTGIDGLDSYTVAKVTAETGTDMSPWPTEKQWTSWLGLCPNNKISGGQVLSSRTKRCANRASMALRIAAQTLYRSKSALGAYFRRMRARLGPAKATTATAHKLARIIYNLLKNGGTYQDCGADYYEQQYQERAVRNLHRRAKELGYKLVPEEAPVVVSASVVSSAPSVVSASTERS
jgi:transposase